MDGPERSLCWFGVLLYASRVALGSAHAADGVRSQGAVQL